MENLDLSIYTGGFDIVGKCSIRNYIVLFLRKKSDDGSIISKVLKLTLNDECLSGDDIVVNSIDLIIDDTNSDNKFNFGRYISAVGIYESYDKIMIYWSDYYSDEDGEPNGLRFLNLTSKNPTEINKPNTTSIQSSTYFVNKISNLTITEGGDLDVGVYQYIYKLVKDGNTIGWSPVSALIPITHNSYTEKGVDRYFFEGSNEKTDGNPTNSSKTISFVIDIPKEVADDADTVIVYRIQYVDNSTYPSFYEIKNENIKLNGAGRIGVKDSSNRVVVSEDQAVNISSNTGASSVVFSALNLCVVKNTLFAANLKEIDTNSKASIIDDVINSPVVDTRVYRFNAFGECWLFNINEASFVVDDKVVSYNTIVLAYTDKDGSLLNKLPDSVNFLNKENVTTFFLKCDFGEDGFFSIYSDSDKRLFNIGNYLTNHWNNSNLVTYRKAGVNIPINFNCININNRINKNTYFDYSYYSRDAANYPHLNEDVFDYKVSDINTIGQSSWMDCRYISKHPKESKSVSFKLGPMGLYLLGAVGSGLKIEFITKDVVINSMANDRITNTINPASGDYNGRINMKDVVDIENIATDDPYYISADSFSKKSLMRDEIYSFGVVLTYENGDKSNVNWIGDIRMPHNSESVYYSEGKAHVLGIRMSVDFKYLGAKAIELVRCIRDEYNRSIISQGIMCNVRPIGFGAHRYSSGGNFGSRTCWCSAIHPEFNLDHPFLHLNSIINYSGRSSGPRVYWNSEESSVWGRINGSYYDKPSSFPERDRIAIIAGDKPYHPKLIQFISPEAYEASSNSNEDIRNLFRNRAGIVKICNILGCVWNGKGHKSAAPLIMYSYDGTREVFEGQGFKVSSSEAWMHFVGNHPLHITRYTEPAENYYPVVDFLIASKTSSKKATGGTSFAWRTARSNGILFYSNDDNGSDRNSGSPLFSIKSGVSYKVGSNGYLWNNSVINECVPHTISDGNLKSGCFQLLRIYNESYITQIRGGVPYNTAVPSDVNAYDIMHLYYIGGVAENSLHHASTYNISSNDNFYFVDNSAPLGIDKSNSVEPYAHSYRYQYLTTGADDVVSRSTDNRPVFIKQSYSCASMWAAGGDGEDLSDFSHVSCIGSRMLIRLNDEIRGVQRGVYCGGHLYSRSIYTAHGAEIPVINVCVSSNINQYNGFTYSSRQLRDYVGVDCFFKQLDGESFDCFCGDVFISFFTHLNGKIFDSTNGDKYGQKYAPMASTISFPIETFYNLDYQNGRSFLSGRNISTEYKVASQEKTGSITLDRWWSDNNPINVSQAKDWFSYNSVYSVNSKINYISSSFEYKEKTISEERDGYYELFDCRIRASAMKIYGEEVDSFSSWLASDYKDYDSKYGSINNIYAHNNTLYFWQNDAFGIQSVMPRQLVNPEGPTDENASVVLGDGVILDRYDYISYNYGNRDQHSITFSSNLLYWLDSSRKKLLSYTKGGAVQELSTLRGVQSYIDRTLNANSIINAGFDNALSEANFNISNNTLIFNEKIGVFSGFYTYKPDLYLNIGKALLSWKNNTLWNQTANNVDRHRNVWYGEWKESELNLISNKLPISSKIFDSVDYQTVAYDENGVEIALDTFTHMQFYTNIQNTGVKTLQIGEDFDGDDDDTNMLRFERRERGFNLNIPRNRNEVNNDEMIFSDRIRDKYLKIKAVYAKSNEQYNRFIIPYINTKFRHSIR